jgi:hypothetical protein
MMPPRTLKSPGAGVAQLVEQLIRNQQVSGSSPLAGSTKFAHLVDSGISPQRILAITFTNKAADEMKRRLTPHDGYGPEPVSLGADLPFRLFPDFQGPLPTHWLPVAHSGVYDISPAKNNQRGAAGAQFR